MYGEYNDAAESSSLTALLAWRHRRQQHDLPVEAPWFDNFGSHSDLSVFQSPYRGGRSSLFTRCSLAESLASTAYTRSSLADSRASSSAPSSAETSSSSGYDGRLHRTRPIAATSSAGAAMPSSSAPYVTSQGTFANWVKHWPRKPAKKRQMTATSAVGKCFGFDAE